MKALMRWLRARWVVVLLTAGGLFTLVSFLLPAVEPTEPAPSTPEARQAIAGLAESSVYVSSGNDAKWRLDAPAARRIIGDRPLLIAGFADPRTLSPTAEPYRSAIAAAERESQAKHGHRNYLGELEVPMLMTCRAIAAEYPDTMVVVLHPRPGFGRACIGSDFPRYEYDEEPPRWPEGVLASASVATERETQDGDMLPLIDDLVPQFEDSAALLEEAPGDRDLGGPHRTVRISGYVVGGVTAAALLFLLLRSRFGAAGERVAERRQRSGARAQAQADVHELAESVLALERDQARALLDGGEPPDPDAVITLAEGYLHVVRAFDGARTTAEYTAVSRRVEDLLARASV